MSTRQVGSLTLDGEIKVVLDEKMRIVCSPELNTLVWFVTRSGAPASAQVELSEALPVDVILITLDGEVMVYFI